MSMCVVCPCFYTLVEHLTIDAQADPPCVAYSKHTLIPVAGVQ